MSRLQVEQYHDCGYFVADDAVNSSMLDELEAAGRRIVMKVCSGEVVDDEHGIRVDGEGEEPRFIRGLLAPEFSEPVFADYLGCQRVSRHLKPFLGEHLRLGMVHLCAIRGDYDGAWHRDIDGHDRDGDYEAEMKILARHRNNFLKWHLALIDDPCLWIVPGSHCRYRTDCEREVLVNNPHAELSSAVHIALRRGQTLFWNGNTIHRGRKPATMGNRLTLMCALINHKSEYDEGEKGDQRWLLAENIRDSLPRRTRGYYDNWHSLAEPRMAVQTPQ